MHNDKHHHSKNPNHDLHPKYILREGEFYMWDLESKEYVEQKDFDMKFIHELHIKDPNNNSLLSHDAYNVKYNGTEHEIDFDNLDLSVVRKNWENSQNNYPTMNAKNSEGIESKTKGTSDSHIYTEDRHNNRHDTDQKDHSSQNYKKINLKNSSKSEYLDKSNWDFKKDTKNANVGTTSSNSFDNTKTAVRESRGVSKLWWVILPLAFLCFICMLCSYMYSFSTRGASYNLDSKYLNDIFYTSLSISTNYTNSTNAFTSSDNVSNSVSANPVTTSTSVTTTSASGSAKLLESAITCETDATCTNSKFQTATNNFKCLADPTSPTNKRCIQVIKAGGECILSDVFGTGNVCVSGYKCEGTNVSKPTCVFDVSASMTNLNPATSKFSSILNISNLNGAILNTSPVTIFVTEDAGINDTTLTNAKSTIENAKKFINGQMVNSEIKFADIKVGDSFTTVNGTKMTIISKDDTANVTANKFHINNNNTHILTDLGYVNGNIHVYLLDNIVQ